MEKIDKYTIEDMAWTAKIFFPDLCDLEPDEKLLKCMRALLIVAKVGYGQCYSVKDFISYVEQGYFIPDDGTGYFCDKDGKEICGVWSSEKVPENAEFVMWFNK